MLELNRKYISITVAIPIQFLASMKTIALGGWSICTISIYITTMYWIIYTHKMMFKIITVRNFANTAWERRQSSCTITVQVKFINAYTVDGMDCKLVKVCVSRGKVKMVHASNLMQLLRNEHLDGSENVHITLRLGVHVFSSTRPHGWHLGCTVTRLFKLFQTDQQNRKGYRDKHWFRGIIWSEDSWTEQVGGTHCSLTGRM